MVLHRPKTIVWSSMERTTSKKEEDVLWIEDNLMDLSLLRIEKNKIRNDLVWIEKLREDFYPDMAFRRYSVHGGS